MKLHEIAEKLELEKLTPAFDKEVTGVYISDMVSDVIANAKAGNLLVTVQVHANALAAANLVDIVGIVVAQGKRPTDDVVKMVAKPTAIIDCFGILDDAKIRRYFELGCEVKGLGRGHVKRLKDEVAARK